MSAEALYNSIKSGKTKLTDLNDAGKEALRGYMSEKANPGGTIDSILSDQHKTEKSLTVTPKPYSMDPVSTYNKVDTTTPKKKGLISEIGSVAKKVGNVLNYPFAKAAEFSVPNANYFGTDINAREDFAKRNPIASTGNKTVDKVGNVLGGIGSIFTPIGTGGAFINDIGKGVSSLLASKSGQAAENIAGKLGSKGANAINPMLNQLGVNLSTNLANKSAQAALRGGALGAGFGALEPFRTGDGNLKDVPKSVLENAAMFAAGDAAMPFLGAGAKALLGKGKLESKLPNYDGMSLSKPRDTPITRENVQPSIHTENNSSPKTKPPISKEEFQKMANSDEYFIRTVRTPEKDIAGRISTPAGKIGIDLGISNDIHKGLSGFNLKDQSRMLEWMGKEGWEHENVAVYKGKPTKEQVTLDPGEVEFNPSQLVGYVPTKSFKEHGGDFHAAFMKNAEKDVPIHSNTANPEPIGLTPKERATQKRIDEFSKVEDNPDIPDTSSQIQSKTIGEPFNLKKTANNAYIKGVDNLHRTNQFDSAAAKAKGSDLKPSDQAYTLALNARGQDMQASQLLNKNFIDAKGEVVPNAQPLSAITKQIPKGQEAAFNDYVVAKHAITRMERGEKVYKDDLEMTIQKAKSIVENYEQINPNFKYISMQYTKFHNDLAQHWYVDTGLFKQSQLDAAAKANPNYVPNKRIFSDLEQQQRYNSKSGVTGQSKPVKRYDPSGSQRKVVNPIESTIEDVARGVKTAKWNEAGQAIVRSLQRNPEELSKFAEFVPDHPKFSVDEMIQKEGLDGVIDHINKSFEDATRNFNKDTGNVVTVLMHGEPIHIRVHDPQFLEAISNLSPKGQDYVTAAVGAATKVMKNVTTGINPIFGLTRNIFRDIPHGYVSSKSTNNPIKYAYDLVGSLISVMKNGKLYNEYKNMGGGHSSPTASDRNLLAQSKEKLLPSKGIKQTLKRALITKPYHALENVNNAAEAAPRLAEFKRQTKLGAKKGLSKYDAKIKALYEANDLTTNFNKFGNVTKNADAYFPYLNAAVQGLDQVARLYSKGGPKRLAQVYAKSIGAITIPSVITYLLYHDDPDYQQLSNFTKDSYLLVGKNKDGSFNKVAKPRELGMVFGTAVERVLREFKDKDPLAFQDFGNNFLKNFLPPGAGGAVEGLHQKGIAGIPGGFLQDTIVGPLVDLERNKNFANQPIVPQDLLGASPRNQFDAKTSEPAKFLGNLTNTSPKQLDFLAKSYLGGIAQLGIPVTTKGGTIGNTLKQQVTADPVFSNDISRNFYDKKNKSDIAKKDASLTGIPQTQDLSPYYAKVATLFTALRNQMKQVQKDHTLSKKEKQAKIREIQIQLNDIQLKATK